MHNKEKELRCIQCARQPLLATYGVDNKGELFVHVKIWKARRIFGELVITGGTVKLRCRDCNRWMIIRIIRQRATLEETHEELPIAITP